jgi:hypothetical protein
MRCTDFDYIHYCIVNEKMIVGTNETNTPQNGVKSGATLSAEITIAKSVGGRPVAEIGPCAFQSCTQLISVRIEAQITAINYAAFYGCTALTHINVPSSVTFIGDGGISGWNGTATSPGTLSVFFEPPSQIQFIGNYGFERFATVIVFFCGATAPSFTSEQFHYVASKHVYAQTNLTFGGVNSTSNAALTFMCAPTATCCLCGRALLPHLLSVS